MNNQLKSSVDNGYSNEVPQVDMRDPITQAGNQNQHHFSQSSSQPDTVFYSPQQGGSALPSAQYPGQQVQPYSNGIGIPYGNQQSQDYALEQQQYQLLIEQQQQQVQLQIQREQQQQQIQQQMQQQMQQDSLNYQAAQQYPYQQQISGGELAQPVLSLQRNAPVMYMQDPRVPNEYYAVTPRHLAHQVAPPDSYQEDVSLASNTCVLFVHPFLTQFYLMIGGL